MFKRKPHFSNSDGPLVIYNGVPDTKMTILYGAILKECDVAVAQAVIRAVQNVDRACYDPEINWLGPIEDVRTAIGHALQATNQTPGDPCKATRQLSPANAHTARTALTHLKYAYEVAQVIDLYDGQPLVGKSGYPYFRVNNTLKQWPEHILSNPDLPQVIRKYARLANITQAEMAVYEVMLSSGARVSEVCSTNVAGVRHCKAVRQFDVRNKCAGSTNTKSIPLSFEALQVVEAYINGDLMKYDPFYQIHSQENINGQDLDGHVKILESENINLDTKHFFYTRNRTPLTYNAFRYSWTKIHAAVPVRARRSIRLVNNLHDLRFWYINAELDRINAAHEHNSPSHVAELRVFIAAMGWKYEQSLEYYDIRTIATQALARARMLESLPTARIAQVDLQARRAQLKAAEAAGLGIRKRGN